MGWFTCKDQIIEFYNLLIEDTLRLFTEEQKADLQEAYERLACEQFSIVVAGRFSAGKSYLINRAFLRQDILPGKNEPTTCHPVHIIYGKENRLTLCDQDGGVETISGGVEAIREALIRYGAQYGGEPNRYDRLVLYWNDPEILRKGMVLVDTIGTEDTDERYIQKTFSEMERATAVIFVFNAKQPGTETERKLIEEHLAGTSKRLFIVLNQSDRLADCDRLMVLDDFITRWRPFFAEYGIRADERIFMVSAKTEDGLADLRKRIIAFVEKERINELLLQHTEWLRDYLDGFRAGLQAHAQDLQDKKNGDERRLRENHLRIQQLEDDLQNRGEEIALIKGDLIEDAIEFIRSEVSSLRYRIKQSVKITDHEDLLDTINDTVDRLMQICDRVGTRLQKDIRANLDKRIRHWGSPLEMERFEARIGSINTAGLLCKGGQALGGVGTLGGGAMLLNGLASGFSAYTAASATAANTGIISGIWTAIAGGGAVSPLMVAVTVAGPLVAGGTLVGVIGYALYKAMDKKELATARNHAWNNMRSILDESERSLNRAINEYVNEQVDGYILRLNKEVSREKKQLEEVIGEVDILVLKNHIDKVNYQLSVIGDYQKKLKILTPS